MEQGFYHPDRGYWQTITEVSDEQMAALYPEGTVRVPLKPGMDYEWQDGEWAYIEPPAPPVVVPDRLSPRQFKTMLYNMGLLASVENWIDAQDPRVRIAFDASTYFYRNQEMMTQGFTVLGFTTEQVDTFFIEADKL